MCLQFSKKISPKTFGQHCIHIYEHQEQNLKYYTVPYKQRHVTKDRLKGCAV